MNSLENTKEIKVQRFNLGHMIKNLLLYFLLLGWSTYILCFDSIRQALSKYSHYSNGLNSRNKLNSSQSNYHL